MNINEDLKIFYFVNCKILTLDTANCLILILRRSSTES